MDVPILTDGDGIYRIRLQLGTTDLGCQNASSESCQDTVWVRLRLSQIVGRVPYGVKCYSVTRRLIRALEGESCLCNMRGMQIRSRPGAAQLVIMVFAGVCLGLLVGFAFMSTVDTVSCSTAVPHVS